MRPNIPDSKSAAGPRAHAVCYRAGSGPTSLASAWQPCTRATAAPRSSKRGTTWAVADNATDMARLSLDLVGESLSPNASREIKNNVHPKIVYALVMRIAGPKPLLALIRQSGSRRWRREGQDRNDRSVEGRPPHGRRTSRLPDRIRIFPHKQPDFPRSPHNRAVTNIRHNKCGRPDIYEPRNDKAAGCISANHDLFGRRGHRHRVGRHLSAGQPRARSAPIRMRSAKAAI